LFDFDLEVDFFFSVPSGLAAILTEPCNLFPLAEHDLELQQVQRDLGEIGSLSLHLNFIVPW
jgi:hypothetical protein